MNKNENEARQKTSGSEEKKEMSPRELHFRITLLGSLLGIPIPQNIHYSEYSNDPIPDDIRANKKDGDEYDTIGDVLKKGGKRKTIIIAVAVLIAALFLFNALNFWGGLGFSIKYGFDFNGSGISMAEPSDEKQAELAEIDPEVVSACDNYELFTFHSKEGIILALRCSEDGAWTELDRFKINAKEGYLFVTGDPSSVIELHIIADGRSIKHSTRIGDSTYRKDESSKMFNGDQPALQEEQAIVLFFRDYDAMSETDHMLDIYSDILKEVPSDGCYAIVVQDEGRS